MEWVVAFITVAILYAYGAGLSALWNAGSWPLVALSGPIAILIAYVFSSEEDRAEFRRQQWNIITARPLRRYIRGKVTRWLRPD